MDIIKIIDSYCKENKTAHINRSGNMSYADLKKSSDALACFIIEHYKDNTKPILVYGHKQHLMIIAFLACIKSGHAYIPVDAYTPTDRINEIIKNSQTNLVLSISKASFDLTSVDCLNSEDIENVISNYLGKEPDSSYKLALNKTCYIIYTSGSTGKPKGVQISLGSLTSFIQWGLKISKITKDTVFMNQAPFSFDLSVMDLYLSLASGSTLFSIDKDMIANTKELFTYFSSSNISIWVSTPSFAEMCLSSEHFNSSLLPKLTQALFCGEVLSSSCVKKLYERFNTLTVTNCYGPTETTVAVTSVDINKDLVTSETPLPVGRVKDDCNIIIKDMENCTVKDGQKGEIVILGESVGLGYLNNLKATKEKFVTINCNGVQFNGYRTGDEGYLIDGMLYYSGRIDNQIKLNGYRIELEDIENNLRKLKIIKSAVVLPFYRNNKIQYLTAIVVLNDKDITADFTLLSTIKKELKKFLPDYMIPRKIVVKDSLPMNTNGKIDRKTLMEEIK